MKKKILFVGEFHKLATGYSTIHKEIIPRIQNAGFEVAELASYISENIKINGQIVRNPLLKDIPWKIYTNQPDEWDQKSREIYDKMPALAFGAWKFDQACLEFKPDIVCVPPGEKIFTINGYKSIENIRVGDLVLTHTGNFRKVTKTMKRQYNGKIVRIYNRGCCIPISLTKEHPVFVFKQRKQTNQNKSIGKIYSNIIPEFQPSENINIGDLIVLPKLQHGNLKEIKVSDYLHNFYEDNGKIFGFHKHKKSIGINNNIKIDNNFGRLIGYLVGDGTLSKDGSVILFFHRNEKLFQDDAIQLFKTIFGVESKIVPYKDRECDKIIVNSVVLRNFLIKLIGKNNNRKIPKEFFISDENSKKGLICGLIRSDGYYAKNTISFSTKYKNLAQELRLIYASLNIPVNLTKIKRYINNQKRTYYYVNAYGNSAKMSHEFIHKKDEIQDLSNHKRRPKKTQMIDDKYLVSSVRRKRFIPYYGQVYNLEIEQDNSYICNQACLHNCDVRDNWMFRFECEHPYRSYYHHVIMPAVDASPQENQWLHLYTGADACFTYSKWAQKELEKQGSGHIKLCGTASPAADYNSFQFIQNREEHKKKFNIHPNKLILGTCARNQKRKLYPDLLEAFAKLITIGPKDITDNLFLYIHTSWPDIGWNIPALIKNSGVGNRILLTYICKQCKNVFPHPFQDTHVICRFCGNQGVVVSNVKDSVNPQSLANIMGLFDLYVQYSSLEGFAMPVVEAAACGVPTMIVNYSATEDFPETLGSIPIKVQRFYTESETGRRMALPDNDDFIKKALEFLSLPKMIRNRKSFETAQLCRKNYDWDVTAQKLINVFNKLPERRLEETWYSHPKILQPNLNVPARLNNEQFVKWGILNILGKPDLLGSYFESCLIRDLNWGISISGFGGPCFDDMCMLGRHLPQITEFNHQRVVQILLEMRNRINFLENERIKQIR